MKSNCFGCQSNQFHFKQNITHSKYRKIKLYSLNADMQQYHMSIEEKRNLSIPSVWSGQENVIKIPGVFTVCLEEVMAEVPAHHILINN